jgi:hypothetical protein
VTESEQADVQDNVLKPIKKENDPHQKREMVITSNHVLRPEIQKRADSGAVVRLDERGIALGDIVREGAQRKEKSKNQD